MLEKTRQSNTTQPAQSSHFFKEKGCLQWDSNLQHWHSKWTLLPSKLPRQLSCGCFVCVIRPSHKATRAPQPKLIQANSNWDMYNVHANVYVKTTLQITRYNTHRFVMRIEELRVACLSGHHWQGLRIFLSWRSFQTSLETLSVKGMLSRLVPCWRWKCVVHYRHTCTHAQNNKHELCTHEGANSCMFMWFPSGWLLPKSLTMYQPVLQVTLLLVLTFCVCTCSQM